MAELCTALSMDLDLCKSVIGWSALAVSPILIGGIGVLIGWLEY